MWVWTKRRVRRIIIEKILHLNDTPHRIAFGVFLGFVVGWTPTMGAQIVLYLLLAMLLRANRASGVLPVLLTNPVTAAPVYFFNWKIGQWLIHGGSSIGGAVAEAQRLRLEEFKNEFLFTHMFDGTFWRGFWPTFRSLGMELMVGCLAVGLLCGVLGYIATFYGVIVYRRRRGTDRPGLRPCPQAARAD